MLVAGSSTAMLDAFVHAGMHTARPSQTAHLYTTVGVPLPERCCPPHAEEHHHCTGMLPSPLCLLPFSLALYFLGVRHVYLACCLLQLPYEAYLLLFACSVQQSTPFACSLLHA